MLIDSTQAAGTFLIWLLFMGSELAVAIERAVTVMVITCPHALGLPVPLVVAVSTALAASHGLLIRNRVAFESARKLQAVIFDKTGTLTEGRVGVTDTLLLADDIDEDTLRKYAASVDANSEHPIAKAIANASESRLPVENFMSIPGNGTEGRVDGREIKVVSPDSACGADTANNWSEMKPPLCATAQNNSESTPTLAIGRVPVDFQRSRLVSTIPFGDPH